MESSWIFAVYRQTCRWWRSGNGTRRCAARDFGGFFFVLALTARGICNFGFVERPIVMGIAWWLCTGDLVPALPLALFFELFWLDLFPIGSYIPPMPGFPYLILLSLSNTLGWTQPVTIAFPLAMTLPLAYAIPYVEQQQRNIQKQASSRLIAHSSAPDRLDGLPGRLLTHSVFQQLVGGLFVFVAAYAIIRFFFSFEVTRNNAGFISLDVDWSILYAIAAIGALLSLRIKLAYTVFAFCMAGLLVFRLF